MPPIFTDLVRLLRAVRRRRGLALGAAQAGSLRYEGAEKDPAFILHPSALASYHSAMESDPLQILLSHDRWATAQILAACGKLSGDQFHRRFDIGPGTLHDTLTHIVGAMRAWTDALAGEAVPRPRIETDGQRRTPEQLLALLEEASQAFAAEARRRPLEEMVTRRMRDGTTGQFTRGVVLAQIMTHGTHHRAQCLNMLRQLEFTPLPASSITEWTSMEAAKV